MKVKICGITNYDDAIHAIRSGADALGFVFYQKSPRYISPRDAKAIITKLPPFVEKVGLFVEESAANIEQIASTSGITLAQLHWDIDDELIDNIDFPVLPVVRARRPDDIWKFEDRYRLIDAYVDGYGGAGQRLALEWFDGLDNSHTIIAGGLTPDNITELDKYGFYGVDVSSGVEATKGKKDHHKVELFVNHAKSLR